MACVCTCVGSPAPRPSAAQFFICTARPSYQVTLASQIRSCRRDPLFPDPWNLARQVELSAHPRVTMSDDQDEDRLDLTQWIGVDRAPDGEIFAGVVGEDRVFVWRNGNRLKACSSDCPHLGRPLNKGIVIGASVRCRGIVHVSTLLPAKATAAPAFDALLEYPVVLQDHRFSVQPASGRRLYVWQIAAQRLIP